MDDLCAACGFDGRGLTTPEIAVGLTHVAERIRVTVGHTDSPALRNRPTLSSWSAIEYVGHLRDVMAFHRWVIDQALNHEVPVIDSVDPDAATSAAAFDEADVDVLLGQLERRFMRLASLLASLDEADESRLVLMQGGASPVDVVFLARNALHEAHHHSLDLERLQITDIDQAARPE